MGAEISAARAIRIGVKHHAVIQFVRDVEAVPRAQRQAFGVQFHAAHRLSHGIAQRLQGIVRRRGDPASGIPRQRSGRGMAPVRHRTEAKAIGIQVKARQAAEVGIIAGPVIDPLHLGGAPAASETAGTCDGTRRGQAPARQTGDQSEARTEAHCLGRSDRVNSRGVFGRGPVGLAFFGGLRNSSR